MEIDQHAFHVFFSLTLLKSLSTEIRKVLSKIAKMKGCEVLADWIKPCERHLHWSATSTFSGNGRVIWAKFKAFLNHVINKHSNFDDPLFNKCNHGDIQPRKWLKAGMNKVLYYLLLSLKLNILHNYFSTEH